MEDTHVADVGLPGGEDVALFAVFDGHGGQVRAGTLPLPARLDRPARPPLWLSSPGRVAGRGALLTFLCARPPPLPPPRRASARHGAP